MTNQSCPLTLKQFKKKHEGHSISKYNTSHEMCVDIFGNIAFHKEMLKGVSRKHKYIRQNHEETIRSYEMMLKELEGVL